MDAGDVTVATLHMLRTVAVALDGEGESRLDADIDAAACALVPELADACVVTRGDATEAAPASRVVRVGDLGVASAEDSISLVRPLVAAHRQLGELRLVRGGGRAPWTEVDAMIADDVAARIGAAIDRQRLRARADEAACLQDEFLATLSHELRTPLHVMVGWIELLRAGLPPERHERAFEVLERNARVQTRLIQDLLDASGILCGRLRLELADVAVADVVLAAVEAIRPQAASQHIALYDHVAASPQIRADGERLGQVLHNLLGNALKFTPPGGQIEVSVDADGETATVAVRDSGVGIAPEFLPRVFDRFAQGGRAPTGTRHGLGLGLFVVRHVVSMHGGTITAESDGPGRGACFTVVLPHRGPDHPGGIGPTGAR